MSTLLFMGFRKGELVRVRFGQRTTNAEVYAASDDGLTLTLMFHGPSPLTAQFLEVIWADGTYINKITAEEISI